MIRPLSSVSRPLAVAAMAATASGLGNVLFSVHDGSVLGLAGARYLFGLVLALLWLRMSGSAVTPRGPGHLVASFASAASPLLLMVSSEYVSTALFTVIVAASPAFTAVLARAFRLPSPSRAASLVALVAVAAALGLASLSSLPPDAVSDDVLPGVLAASASALALSISFVAMHRLPQTHPAQLLQDMCSAGILMTALLSPLLPFRVAASTVSVALLVAVLPGGLAKAALFWSVSRTSPQLVSSVLSLSVPVSAVAGWLLLGERMSAPSLVAAMVSVAATSTLPFLAGAARPLPPASGSAVVSV